jgi:hypothetical protein
MTQSVARVDLSQESQDFQHHTLEPGLPALDGEGANAEIAFGILGRFAARPQWTGTFVEFSVHDDCGVRVPIAECRPVTAEYVEAHLAGELAQLRQQLAKYRPTTRNDGLVQQLLKKRLDAQLGKDRQDAADGFLLEYSSSPRGPKQLVCCWGFQRVDTIPAQAVLCRKATCHALYLEPAGFVRKCPQCYPHASLRKKTGTRVVWLAALTLLLLGALGIAWLVTPQAVLVGTVTDGADGAPVRSAEVRIGDQGTVFTDQEGRFRKAWLRSGELAVQVVADGYPNAEIPAELQWRRESPVAIRLSGDAVLVGRVGNLLTGQPIPGAIVTVGQKSRTVTTDSQGKFRIQGLRRGTATVNVAATGFTEFVQRLKLVADDNTLNVLLASGALLRGRIVRAVDQGAISGATVRIDGTLLSANSDDTGGFLLPATRSGPLAITVSADGYRPEQRELDVHVGLPTETEITLGGSAVVTGTVIDGQTRQPVVSAEVRLSDAGWRTKTDGEGKFRIEGARSGRTAVEVVAAGYGASKSEIELAPDAETPVEVVLGGAGGLKGVVVDKFAEVPIAQAEVRIAGTSVMVNTDAQGQFQMTGIRSGTIKLEVTAAGYSDAAFQEEVRASDPTELRLVLAGRSVVTGVVTNALTKQPVPRATVRMEATSRTAESDEQGRFHFDHLRSGAAEFRVAAEGFGSRTVSEQLSPDKETELKIELGGDAVLEGQIVNAATKEPLSGARITIGDTSLAATSAADGRFRLDGAFAGIHQVKVEADGFAPLMGQKTLSSGKPTSLGLVPLKGAGRIVGRIISAGEKTPVVGAKITLPSTKYETISKGDGAFEIGQLPSGAREFLVTAAGYSDQRVVAEVSSSAPTQIGEVRLASKLAISGTVINAIDERPINNATVIIVGTDVKVTSDSSGRFQLDGVPNRLLKVQTIAEGFFDDLQEIDPSASDFTVRSVLSPKLRADELRIVLTWGSSPRDLDAHLYGPGAAFHVSHERREATGAKLDVDNRDGYGPETITISNAADGVYSYKVHAYQDPKDRINQMNTALASSGATVKVYYAGARQPALFAVDRNAVGTTWNTCSITLKKGQPPRIGPDERIKRYTNDVPK